MEVVVVVIVVVVVVVVVYLHEKKTNSVKGMNITEKLYNIIYRIQFQTYTMQTRPSQKCQNLQSEDLNYNYTLPGVDKQINNSADKTNYSNHSYL